MKKGILICLIVPVFSAFAQIPNGGFEIWNPDSAGILQPEGWPNNNTTEYQVVNQVTPGYSGDFALEITLDNDGFSGTNGFIKGGFTCDYLPDVFSFFYKADFSLGGAISGFAAVYDSAFTTLAATFLNIYQTQGNWTLVSQPFDSFAAGIPDTALILMVISGNIFTPGWFHVDDMMFGIPTAAEAGPASEPGASVYYEEGILHVFSTGQPASGLMISIWDLSGRNVYQQTGATTSASGALMIPCGPLQPGIYLLQVRDNRNIQEVKLPVR